MKAYKYVLALVFILILTIPALAETDPPDIPDTGSLYGDLYVILRDEDGIPMLAENGCLQPISSVDGSTTITTNEGELEIIVYEGEPFALPSYTDTAGDEVECELTEEMATWVQTVDFGRLNLGRAPDFVIAHAFDEAIKKMNTASAITIDPAGRLVLTLPDPDDATTTLDKTIDAPAENLALYIKMMIDGHWITEEVEPIENGGRPEGKGPPEGDGPSTDPRPVLSGEAISLLPPEYQGLGDTTREDGEDLTQPELLLAASLLAAAADKTGSITLDMVVYINFIYGINQIGSLSTEVEDETYFNFGALTDYQRTNTYTNRKSGLCNDGWIWVLQPEEVEGAEVPGHFVAQCMEILGYENADHDPTVNAVHFTDMEESYETVSLTYDFTDNVRAFAQACDDALQVIEYIHNYKVPEVLYPVAP